MSNLTSSRTSSVSSSFSSSSSSSWEADTGDTLNDGNKGKGKKPINTKKRARVPHTVSGAKRTTDRVCAFCRRGHREGLEFSRGFIDVLTEENVWATECPFVQGAGARARSYYVHTVCAHFCPQTSFDVATREWAEVNTEYQRSRSLSCVICGKKGATIGCHIKNCNSSCHFPCGIKDNRRIWSPGQDLQESPFFCPNHQDRRRAYERDAEIRRADDLSRGKERIAIPLDLSRTSTGVAGFSGVGSSNGKPVSEERREFWANVRETVSLPRGIVGSGVSRPFDFTYVSETIDSKSARIRRGPEREKRCCSCTGPNTCRVYGKCACKADGRTYSSKGRCLDWGHPAPIYECNLNCACQARDTEGSSCRNRLVQRGITYKLMVAHFAKTPENVSAMCGPWGVKAAEDIPKRGFVCTVAGQLALASDFGTRMPENANIGSATSANTPRRVGAAEPSKSNMLLVHHVRDWIYPKTDISSASGENRGGVDRELVVDQRRYANISRYLRRARTEAGSNLLRVAVHTTNRDPSAPVLALFAADVIPKGTELLLGP